MTKLAVNLAIDVVFLKNRSNIKTANDFESLPLNTEHILTSFTPTYLNFKRGHKLIPPRRHLAEVLCPGEERAQLKDTDVKIWHILKTWVKIQKCSH